MRLVDFDYNLPKEFIAQYPLENRAESKLMVLERKSGKISHHKFTDLVSYLNSGDALILNDTKVLPARLFGEKKETGGRVEIFLLNRIEDNLFNALMRPGRIKKHQKLIFKNNGLEAEILDRDKVRFNTSDIIKIYRHGNIPLPPYIKRLPNDIDTIRYQSVYAKNEGAVAAPTAGLHFTNEILSKLRERNVNIGYLTLHISWGTFKPVRSLDVTKHQMEKEYFQIPKKTQDLMVETKKNLGRLFAVGTTTTRALESMAATGKDEAQTDLFIYPGYNFEVVDCLLTNFHLPRSTLLMLVCAFAGRDFIMRAYDEAVKNNYRFYSYGDCMLII